MADDVDVDETPTGFKAGLIALILLPEIAVVVVVALEYAGVIDLV